MFIFDKKTNRYLVVFGGTVGVTSGYSEKSKDALLILSEVKKTEIGSLRSHKRDNERIIFTFNKPESIDVVIDRLKETKFTLQSKTHKSFIVRKYSLIRLKIKRWLDSNRIIKQKTKPDVKPKDFKDVTSINIMYKSNDNDFTYEAKISHI